MLAGGGGRGTASQRCLYGHLRGIWAEIVPPLEQKEVVQPPPPPRGCVYLGAWVIKHEPPHLRSGVCHRVVPRYTPGREGEKGYGHGRFILGGAWGCRDSSKLAAAGRFPEQIAPVSIAGRRDTPLRLAKERG